ncbi:hypothetical protein I3842_12G111300 [Carya illinoinensis]|uniref:RNase H type-1 domain-containing protein n=1 Tax=Carya illinoinensis TaxID=32201 RepID=A0A922DJC3_CARIL|nr:hypothetical protein I3842_12G111300 [Carya illinoinensis]
MCPICLSEEESSLHAIWSCLAARDVWCQGFKKLQKAVFDVCDFKGLLKAWFSHFGQDQVEVIAVIAHKIWQRRNRLLFEEKFTHPSELMRLSLQAVKDYQEAAGTAESHLSVPSSCTSSWTAPPEGFYKVNWDSALCKNTNMVGIGIIVRDHGKNVIAAKRMRRIFIQDPLIAEAYGACQAVSFAQEIGLRKIVLEGILWL